MSPMDLALFGNDPWWLVIIKAVLLFVLLLLLTIFNVWFERRVVAFMQHRKGPNMNGPFGLFQALADGSKLILKEDFAPSGVDKVIFTLAPFIMVTSALSIFSVIPIGGTITVPFTDIETQLQLTDSPVSVLLILAIASVGIYGVVLAGWSSTSTYSLLGALRSSAQMISYEIAMGLSLVGVFLFAGSMSTSEIVSAQQNPIVLFNVDTGLPGWFALLLLPSFIIYGISMVGETNRAPFDLPEAESELVAGYLTDYSGMRYALFFLAEYVNMLTVSAIATTLFMGGWHAPWPFNLIEWADAGLLGPVWFFLKVYTFMFIFVWLRGTLPRFRYDQFMDLGWKWLIPISLLWLVVVAVLRMGITEGWFANRIFLVVAGVLVVAALALAFFGGKEEPDPGPKRRTFDPFAGGFPVPPMPGQRLPGQARVVQSSSTATATVERDDAEHDGIEGDETADFEADGNDADSHERS